MFCGNRCAIPAELGKRSAFPTVPTGPTATRDSYTTQADATHQIGWRSVEPSPPSVGSELLPAARIQSMKPPHESIDTTSGAALLVASPPMTGPWATLQLGATAPPIAPTSNATPGRQLRRTGPSLSFILCNGQHFPAAIARGESSRNETTPKGSGRPSWLAGYLRPPRLASPGESNPRQREPGGSRRLEWVAIAPDWLVRSSDRSRTAPIGGLPSPGPVSRPSRTESSGPRRCLPGVGVS